MWEWLKRLFAMLTAPSVKAEQKGVLVLIVGHSSKAPGAYGIAPLSMSEYPYNKNMIAPECVSYGSSKGLDVQVLNKDALSTWAVGKKASDIVAAKGAGCVIELHFNATAGASGTETLYCTKNANNKRWAEICQNKMVAVFQKPNRGLKLRNSGRGASNLAAVTVPGCLVEPLFGDTKGDALLLRDKATEYARCLVDAAIEFIGPAQVTAPTAPTTKTLMPNKAWHDHMLSKIKASKLLSTHVSDTWFKNTAENWAHLMCAVIKYESNFSPTATYTENFRNGKGELIVSTGLFQVSYESVAGYGFSGMTTEKLKDPYLNIEIGVAIFEKLIGQDGSICGGGVMPWKGAARYFSTLRLSGKLESVKALYKQYAT